MASNDRIGLEAIRALHRQLDDDANGNVDLSESDEITEINGQRARLADHVTPSISNVGIIVANDGGCSICLAHVQAHIMEQFLREELKYEQGYERRQRAFHFNDDMHISVRELWEAWIRSEVSRYNSLLASCRHAHLRTRAVGSMDPV
uniref:STIM1/2 EF-hand domain-containing protein n=1 Tax=Timema poppense TaxID=170557 RepID=A0A7R9DRL5_TIMPO|nr:unnamed protein product [Timema poppensis]